MNLLSRLLRPAQIAHAHCDAPCGVYDPADARITAEAVLSLSKKLQALPDSQDVATENTRTRFIAIKEEQAEMTKRQLEVLWSDYFKPEHLEKYPDLHEVFWKAVKLASKAKQEVNPDAAEELMQQIEKIHGIFWATKGREVPFYRAS